MSLFGGLFRKKEKPQEPVSPHIDTPWGPFYYNGTKYNQFEYEGMVDWYDDEIYEPCDVCIECNDIGTDDMSMGYQKFVQFMENKADIDYQVKMTALDYFDDGSGLVMSAEQKCLMSKELFLDDMYISGITIHRDGRVVFGLYGCDFPDVDAVYVIFGDNTPAVVRVRYHGDNSAEFFSDL